jgi:hypothetical protein
MFGFGGKVLSQTHTESECVRRTLFAIDDAAPPKFYLKIEHAVFISCAARFTCWRNMLWFSV